MKAIRELEGEEYCKEAQIPVPPEIDARFQRCLNKKCKRAARFQDKPLHLRRTFVIAAMIVMLLIGAVTAIHHLLIEEHGEYAVIYDIRNTVDQDPAYWEGYYLPTNIPKGFTLTRSEDIPGQRIVVYDRLETERIYFYQSTKNNALYMDNETYISEHVKIGNIDGYLFQKDTSNTLFLYWINRETQFCLETQAAEKDELLQMAASVARIENNLGRNEK